MLVLVGVRSGFSDDRLLSGGTIDESRSSSLGLRLLIESRILRGSLRVSLYLANFGIVAQVWLGVDRIASPHFVFGKARSPLVLRF